MTTTLNLTIAVPAELTNQQNSINARIREIDTYAAELVAERKNLESSLERVNNAIKFLTGEITVPTAKPDSKTGSARVMSPEARAKISEALKRSAAAKKAAASAPTAPEAAPEPVLVAASQPEAEKPAKAAKGGRK